MKFSTAHGVREITGNQVLARECYQAAFASGENNTWLINEQEPILNRQKHHRKLGDLTKALKIGLALPTLEKEKMVSFLRVNQDVFAWKHKDMPRIDRKIIQQRLNVNSKYKLVQQKRRIFAPKHNKAAIEAGFIREVFYLDWLANVVMVKKSNGKWRMCVDFIDLNKAYPKDSFPLPRINQLVDSTTGHKLLSFMDAFSRYNQILMDE